MKFLRNPNVLVAIIAVMLGVMAILLTACAPKGPVEQQKTPQQVWIEAHPTYLTDTGACMEFDDEPCDDDPYDLDDWYESFNKTKAPSKKPSPRPMQTAFQPKPSPAKTAATKPVTPRKTR